MTVWRPLLSVLDSLLSLKHGRPAPDHSGAFALLLLLPGELLSADACKAHSPTSCRSLLRFHLLVSPSQPIQVTAVSTFPTSPSLLYFS